MAYWILALLVTAFGFVTGFSIGQPIFLLGLALLVLGRWRRNARIFWPGLLAVVGFDLGFVLTAPWICTATSFDLGPSVVECWGALGSTRLPDGVMNPPREPAIRAAIASAFVIGAGTAVIQALRARSGGP
ncbi:MAG: hypothetical protein C0498_09555 [Anaerolinea sp.]|nr:hypothetical protein [Anaerolinea sp.]